MDELKQDLLEAVKEIDFIGIKPEGIKLKSGKWSKWYANCRKIASKKLYLDEIAFTIAQILAPQIKDQNIDMVMGIPEGATRLAQEVNDWLIEIDAIQDNIYQKRTKPKEHGDPANKFWVTGIRPKRIWLFEDVTTSGISTIEFIELLEEEDPELEIVGVIALLTRLQLDENGVSVAQKLESMGKQYMPLLTANDVLPPILAEMKDGDKWRQIINQEYLDEYGVNPPVSL